MIATLFLALCHAAASMSLHLQLLNCELKKILLASSLSFSFSLFGVGNDALVLPSEVCPITRGLNFFLLRWSGGEVANKCTCRDAIKD